MPISQANKQPGIARPGQHRLPAGRDEQDGFTLIEVVLALAVLALLAVLGLPFVRPDTGATALRAKTFEITALLRAERNAALRTGLATTVRIDVERATIISDRSPSGIVMPASFALRMSSNRLPGFRFYPDGRALGGLLSVASQRGSYIVEVNGVTSAISITRGET